MIRKIYIYAILLTAIVLITGCAVHQWPEPKPQPAGRVKIVLHYEPDFWVWEHMYDPRQEYPEQLYPDSGTDPEHPGTSYVYSNLLSMGVMRVCIKVFNAGNTDKCIMEHIFDRDLSEGDGYDCEAELELDGGNYEVAVWSHLLENTGKAPYYEPGDFRSIYIIDDNYCGSTDYRDGFRGRQTFSLPAEPVAGTEYRCEVEMRRPMGKFEFVTTDLSEFLDRETERRSLPTRANAEDYRVVVSYPYYYPNAYNIIADDIASGSGYGFETRMTVTGQSEASIGFDYVFIKNIQDGAVQASVSVFDLGGVCVANSRVIMIPIRRDHHTLLRGAFLSMDAEGGVGVIPDYDGDHNVTMP